MKIAFFGTSEFAASVLRLISARCSVVAVITRPDKAKGRGRRVLPSPIKKEAEALGIAVFQPANVNSAGFAAELKELKAEAFIVVSFGSMLGRELLDAAQFGSLNIHPSLLPKYRGAAPIPRSLLAGEEKTGVTIIKMNEKLDAGDIMLQKEVKVEKDDTSETLSGRLAAIGAELLAEAMRLVKEGGAKFVKQDDSRATYAPKLKKSDGAIRWSHPTEKILNSIRALKPWPGTYSVIDGRTLKIISAEPARCCIPGGFLPGQVIEAHEKNGFIVKTGSGALSILRVQIEGKKEMPAELFLRGHRIKRGALFS